MKRVEAAAKINKIGVSFVFLLANAGKRPLGFGLAGLGRAGLGVDDVLSPPPPLPSAPPPSIEVEFNGQGGGEGKEN